MSTLHPDVAPVFQHAWGVGAPTVQSGRWLLALESTHQAEGVSSRDRSTANLLARRLLRGAWLEHEGVTVNGRVVRFYRGSGPTALAERRG